MMNATRRSRLDIAAELADNLTPYPGKICGGCTACCSTLAVRELGLPNWTRCPHVRTPPDAVTGCSIYANRPNSCRAWICGWRAADWADDCRPDRCGVIVDPMPDLVWVNGEELPVARLWVLPGHEEAYRRDPVQALVLAIVHAGHGVLWDMAPNKEGQRLAQVIRRNAAGQIEMSYPTASSDTGMSEAERSFRAMGWNEGLDNQG